MAVTPFQDLPLADRRGHWDADDGEKRIRVHREVPQKMGEKAP